ncbi:hypothetical protein IMY05_014G0072700 [Salix suchowensis]|nr:hypothetical protein IMY05_014G0072700 [Salix suchowensis]
MYFHRRGCKLRQQELIAVILFYYGAFVILTIGTCREQHLLDRTIRCKPYLPVYFKFEPSGPIIFVLFPLSILGDWTARHVPSIFAFEFSWQQLYHTSLDYIIWPIFHFFISCSPAFMAC